MCLLFRQLEELQMLLPQAIFYHLHVGDHYDNGKANWMEPMSASILNSMPQCKIFFYLKSTVKAFQSDMSDSTLKQGEGLENGKGSSHPRTESCNSSLGLYCGVGSPALQTLSAGSRKGQLPSRGNSLNTSLSPKLPHATHQQCSSGASWSMSGTDLQF